MNPSSIREAAAFYRSAALCGETVSGNEYDLAFAARSQTYPRAAQIADSLIGDLIGRCGIGDEWEQLEPDVCLEIRATWIEKVKVILDG